MKKSKILTRLFVLMFALAIPLGACSGDEKSKTGPSAAPVRVEPATNRDVAKLIRAVGNVRPSASIDVVPRVAGEILDVMFTEGQDVRAGQPLLRIDPRPYQAALNEKKGVLAKSEAQLAKALEDRRRFGRLVSQGYVSREAYDQTATDAAALQATVLSDRAAVQNAALDLGYCTVTAPISGRIGPLKVDKGNMIKSSSQEPIAGIVTLSPCYVSFSVPEVHLPAIQAEMRKGPVRLVATPTGGSAQHGILTLVDNSVDEKTGAIRLRATFENREKNLWPGQFVEVALPLGELTNATLVPSRAIQAGRDGHYIYIVDNAGKAALRPVEILFENGGESAIKGDVKAGDNVVVEGQVRLSPGLPAHILD